MVYESNIKSDEDDRMHVALYSFLFSFFLIWLSKWKCSRAGFTRADVRAARWRCRMLVQHARTLPPFLFSRVVVSWVSQSRSRRPLESGCVDLAFKPQHACHFWAWKPPHTPGVMSPTTPHNALQLDFFPSRHSSSHDISASFSKRRSCRCHSGKV